MPILSLTRRAVIFSILTFSSAALFAGCNRGPSTGGDAILIGVVLPTTGREGKPGQYQKEGIELAIKKINDGGGVFVKEKDKKLPLKEVFYDDASDQAKSASLTE